MGKVYWTYEACYNVAKECISRKELEKKYIGAYRAAWKNHWLDDYTWFRPTSEVKSKALKGLNEKWSYEKCFELAKEYTSRNEFQNGCAGAYFAAWKNHWLDDYTWFKSKAQANSDGHKGIGLIWTYEKCFEAAKSCETKSEFKYKYHSAYNSARNNGWYKDYTWFEEDLDIYGTPDNVYRYYFKDFNAIYVGRTVRPKIRDRQHTYALRNDTVFQFAHEHDIPLPPMEILVSNITLKEGQRLEKFYVDLYREQGYTILNRGKTGSLGLLKR